MEVTVAQAAKAVGKSPVTIRGLIARGELRAQKKGRYNYVDLNAVHELFVERSENVSGTHEEDGSSDRSVHQERLINVLQTQVETLHAEREWMRKQFEREQEQRLKVEEQLFSAIAEMKALMFGSESSKPSRWIEKFLK